MSVLITGAGIVGCQVARVLVDRGQPVVMLDLAPNRAHIESLVPPGAVEIVQGDVRDAAALETLAVRHDVRDIVHTAALLTGPSALDPRRAVEVNVGGAVNMLELARQGVVRRVVLSGSTTVTYSAFESYADGGIPEDFAMRAVSQQPGSFYSATKLAMEFVAGLYHREFNVDAVVVRYGAVLGAWGGQNDGLVARMLSNLLAAAQQARPAVVADAAHIWQGIEEFVDARDCASGTVAALDAVDLHQRVYTLSSDKGWTWRSFIDAVREVCPDLQVDCRVDATGGFARFPHPRRATSDISAAARDLGWSPKYSLRESIEHFAAVTKSS